MGGICSSEQVTTQQQVVKLLLLGNPSVGKSTVFKQLSLLYDEGFNFSDEYRANARGYILATTLETIEHLMKHLYSTSKFEDQSMKDTFERLLHEISCRREELVQLFARIDQGTRDESLLIQNWKQDIQLITESLDLPIVKKFDIEQAESAANTTEAEVSKTFPEFGLYFLERFKTLEQEERERYVPSNEDILRLRRITFESTSVKIEASLEWPPRSQKFTSIPIQCVDVGGQEHHEFDWVQHGASATSIVFVMCISDFDEKDENGGNKLMASFSLLRKVVSSAAFRGKQYVILFNKSDLLQKKLEQHQVRDYFHSYEGANTEEAVVNYFEERVHELIEAAVNENEGFSDDAHASVMSTCAVDSELMKEVLTRVLFGLFQSQIRKVWN